MSATSKIEIAPARIPEDVETVRSLFRDYVASLGIDLGFQDVEAELAGLPGKYAPPRGAILIARAAGGDAVGCVALRPLPEPGACEMKRLYVKPSARGLDLGRRLALAVIAAAREAGYDLLRLDTLAGMGAAQGLYATLGFEPTAAYYDNPVPGTRYLALNLRGHSATSPAPIVDASVPSAKR